MINGLDDMNEYFETLCLNLKILKPELMYNLITYLVEKNSINYISEKLGIIGIKYVLVLINAYKEDKDWDRLIEIICENPELLTMDNNIEYKDIELILDRIKNDQDKESIIYRLIEIFSTKDKLKLIDYICRKDDINKYIDSLISNSFSQKDQYYLIASQILKRLMSIEDVNKIILIKAIEKRIEYLKTFGQTDLIDVLGQLNILQKELSRNVKADKAIINIKNVLAKDLMNIIRQGRYNIQIINIMEELGVETTQMIKNQEEIIENLSGEELLKYIQGRKEFFNEWSVDNFVKQVFKCNGDIMKDITSQKMLSILVSELCSHENIKPVDIISAGAGYYSLALKIGDYILEIGKERKTYEIVDDPRVIRPLIRQQTNPKEDKEEGIEIDDKQSNLYIEIQDVVDMNWTNGLTNDEVKEELYEIYRELRNRDIFWTDVKPDNVGRLIKPNKGTFITKDGELKSDNEAIGFKGKKTERILQPGELVIIDTDFILSVHEMKKHPVVAKISYYVEFEKRYQKEREQLKQQLQKNER